MKIKVSELCYSMLERRIHHPHYLDPQTGSVYSSICLDRDTLKFCNAADLNPKTGTVRNATFVDHVNDSICKMFRFAAEPIFVRPFCAAVSQISSS